MKIYTIEVRFTWGARSFTFPHEYEAKNFRDNILMCKECIWANAIVERTE